MADLISRAALLNDLSYCAPELWQDEEYIKAKIMKQPAVPAMPVVHARWIPHKTPSGRETIFERCSVCKQPTIVTRETPYCPYCGAKMDGERRDDDAAD